MQKHTLLLLLLILHLQLNAQEGDNTYDKDSNKSQIADTMATYPNSLPQQLNEVVVKGYEQERKLIETAGAIALLDRKALDRFDPTTMIYSMNTIAGVRMERRAPGSFRMSIRGSSLRSPFGVRNIKVYWDDIPFTEPNGSTPINLIDINTINEIELIKGPASSLFGAGNGGALSLKSRQADYQNSLAIGSSIGDLGNFKYSAQANAALKNGGIKLHYAHQEAEGYRQHSALNRDVVYLQSNFYPSEKSSISLFTLLADLQYELPGGLNEDQFAEDPSMARPGSEEKNASIDRQTLYSGLSFKHLFNDNWKAVMSVYGANTQLENPFNTNYKTEAQTAYGWRAYINYKTILNEQMKLDWKIGAEYQKAWSDAKNFGNIDGQKDTLNFADDIQPQQYFLFQQAELSLPGDLLFTLGLSWNRSGYDIERVNYLGMFSESEIDFEAVISPRIALSKTIHDKVGLHISMSRGFSPPTLDEVRTSEGTINTELLAEKGTNWEAGVRGTLFKDRFNFDISAFLLKLDDAIVNQVAENGTVLFYNAGKTDNKGLEVYANYIFAQNANPALALLKTWASYTRHHFLFDQYKKRTGGENVDYSNNLVTGVAPNILAAGIDWHTQWGPYINLSYNFTDEIPLTDSNEVFSGAYHLVNLRMGYRQFIKSHWQLDVYGVGNNLLDEKYSLGNDLNAFGKRYFQPAPPTHFFAGFELKYLF